MTRLTSLGPRLFAAAMRAASMLPLPLSSGGVCCICGSTVATFLPYAPNGRLFRTPSLISELDIVGSAVHRFSCPRCLSHDRERHLLLYLRAIGLDRQLSRMRILHIAPERHLARLIAGAHPVRYVKGDLFPTEPAIERLDLQCLAFEADTFDLVIANHVLEHIVDDARALKEIARVLVPGGKAILQTPYSPVLTRTFEDPGISLPQARYQAYGQEDHVRLYGRDIFDRFAAVGLEDMHVTHAQLLADVDPHRYGVNAAEPLFLFGKPEEVVAP